MIDDLGMAGLSPLTRQKQLVDWVHVMITDLHSRASALERVVATSHTWRIDPDDSAPDSDPSPETLMIRVDRDAWLTAVSAASATRPPYPEPD